MKKYYLLSLIILLSCARSYRSVSIREIFNQKKKVRSLWWKGKICIRTSKNELSGNILVLAKKNPLLVRIEISNWISGTILCGFIKERNFLFISPKERRVYVGEIPEDIGKEEIWTLIRTIPLNADVIFKGDEIVFFHRPIKIVFKNAASSENIAFSKRIDAYYLPRHITLHFEIKKIFFNRNIPSQLFNPKIPPNFQILRYQIPTL